MSSFHTLIDEHMFYHVKPFLSGVFEQAAYRARFEWGEQGIRTLASHADATVIVDVLSFSTAVEVACSRGCAVYPYRWRDASAAQFAAQVGAELAVPRQRVTERQPYSLAPGSLRSLPPGSRLVLPSPNGSTLTLLAAELCSTVVAGCLRNASSVALSIQDGSVAVIAAGERWPDGSLRPALEDMIGAGAILCRLPRSILSPEAAAAVAVFEAAAADLYAFIRDCASGRELIEMGFPEDVAFAAELDCGTTVPRFTDGAYR